MAKIGEAHFKGMVRLGMKELRNAVDPSKEGISDTEVGLYGTATQMEVNNQKGVKGVDPEQSKAAMYSLSKDAEHAMKNPEGKGEAMDAKGNEPAPKMSMADLRKEVAQEAEQGKEAEQSKEPEMERE